MKVSVCQKLRHCRNTFQFHKYIVRRIGENKYIPGKQPFHMNITPLLLPPDSFIIGNETIRITSAGKQAVNHMNQFFFISRHGLQYIPHIYLHSVIAHKKSEKNNASIIHASIFQILRRLRHICDQCNNNPRHTASFIWLL